MWTTRPVFRFFRSARLLACGFTLMTASFIQGELGRSGTTFSFSGACLFRRPRRVALYRSRRSSTPSGEPITRGDWAISARNSDSSETLLISLEFSLMVLHNLDSKDLWLCDSLCQFALSSLIRLPVRSCSNDWKCEQTATCWCSPIGWPP